jgi:hypothetical protein
MQAWMATGCSITLSLVWRPSRRLRRFQARGRGPCRYHPDWVPICTRLKSRQGAGHIPKCHHVSYSTGPYLLAKVGSGAVMCLVAPYATFLIGRALVPPCVPWLRTPPPCRGGLRCTMCPTALDHTSVIKKSLAGLTMQLRLLVPNARMHVYKVSDVRAIMGL